MTDKTIENARFGIQVMLLVVGGAGLWFGQSAKSDKALAIAEKAEIRVKVMEDGRSADREMMAEIRTDLKWLIEQQKQNRAMRQ